MSVFDDIRSQVMRIPRGFVSTYGNVAAAAGIKNPRVTGYAIYKNTHPEIIPCHRVVQKDGHLALKFSLGGIDAQRQKLLEEGIKFIDKDTVNMSKYFWDLTLKQRQIAIVIFYDKDNNIYLQDRRLHNKIGEKFGFWGGGIEPGETPDIAMRRELMEEINFAPQNLIYLGQKIFDLSEFNQFKEDHRIVTHIYISKILPNITSRAIREGDGWFVVPLKDVRSHPDLDIIDKQILADFTQWLN